MSNICDTQYKVRGSRKALSDLWKCHKYKPMDCNHRYISTYRFAFYINLTTI